MHIPKTNIVKDTESKSPDEIDVNEIYRLAHVGLSMPQVRARIGVSDSVWIQETKWHAAYNSGKAHLVEDLVSEQIAIALNRDHKDQCKMLIHLGKSVCDQREVTETKSDVTVTAMPGYSDLLDLINESNQTE